MKNDPTKKAQAMTDLEYIKQTLESLEDFKDDEKLEQIKQALALTRIICNYTKGRG